MELNDPFRWGVAFDSSLADSRTATEFDFYRMKNGVKLVQWKGGEVAFCHRDGFGIPVATLHAQGNQKKVMRKFMQQRSWYFYFRWFPLALRQVCITSVKGIVSRVKWVSIRVAYRLRRILSMQGR